MGQIDTGGGLVENEQVGVTGQGSGDQRPLLLAAGFAEPVFHPHTPIARAQRRGANLRDRLLYLFIPSLAPDIPAEELEEWEGTGDPIDFIIVNNLYIVAIAIGAGMIPLVAPRWSQQMPHALHPLLESGILLTAIAAVLLNLYFNGARGDASDAIHAAKMSEAH